MAIGNSGTVLRTVGNGKNIGKRVPLSVGFQEFINTAPAKREWLVKGLVAHKCITYISGQEKKAMKTFFALALAQVIAGQKGVGGLKPGNKAGTVLYVLEEGEDAETRERMLAIQKGIGTKVPDDKFRFLFHSRVKLDTAEWRRKILLEVETHEAIAVFFDTMTYMFEGEENSATDVNLVIDTLQAIRKKGCAVICLFHMRKGTEKGDDPDGEIRGSGVFAQARDNHLALRRYNRKRAIIDLSVLKRGGVEDTYGVLWNMHNIECEDEDGDPFYVLDRATPCLIEISGDRALRKWMKGIEEDTAYSLRDLQAHWDCGTAQTKLVLNALVEHDLMEADGKGVFIKVVEQFD